MDMSDRRHNKTIDIHYLEPGGTNFSFITHMPIPLLRATYLVNSPELAFSADGSKFAIAMDPGMSVWDIRSKVPLQTFMEAPLPPELVLPDRLPQFSSGDLGKEILVFVEVRIMFTF